MWTFIVVSVLLIAGLRAQDYDNTLRGILRHTCPNKHVVSQINSSYSAIDQDRQWKIECKALGTSSDCSWSRPQDLNEKELSYNCPANHVVAGVYSSYNNAHGDRRWKLLCCSAPNLFTFECRQTTSLNYWEEDFLWQVPEGHFLTGVQTHHKNPNNGDHRWTFNYCKGTTQVSQTINSQILTANQQLPTDVIIEGDIFIPNGRNALNCAECRWPKLSQTVDVPFIMSDSFSSSDRTAIQSAMDGFHLSSCIRFVPRTSQSDYINIVKEQGCFSQVGRTGRSQHLSLGAGCIQRGVIQHELLHALGFYHEQSRGDRDAHVRINYENIQQGQERNFDRLDTNNQNVEYDYASVMHYASRDFSKNTGDTITPLDPSVQIGQREGMSEKDILKINKLYVCKAYLHQYDQWDNKLTNAFSHSCPPGQAVSGITSLFSGEHKDRLWSVSCKAFKLTRTCRWSAFVNSYWGEMNYNCGDNEVIAGVYSDYSSIFNDRKWKFYCCSTPGFTTSNCQTETNINYFKEYFSWTVASDHYLTGVTSSIDYTIRDRRWTLRYCRGNSQ